MDEIRIFENEQFGQIRTAGTSENPLFCLSDICRVLGIKNVSDCKSRLKQDGIVQTEGVSETTNQYGVTSEQSVTLTFINEQNLYKLIMRSDKPQAEPFQDWVCGDVLPTIRKIGSYSLNNPSYQISDPIKRAEKWIEEEKERQRLALENKQQAEKIEEDRPKVEFFDDVADSKTAVELAVAAKTLNFVNVGRNNLFEFLRNNKVLLNNNTPYQKYIDCGYFRIIEQRFVRPDGTNCINFKTLVYQRGIDFIRKLLLKKGYKPNNK